MLAILCEILAKNNYMEEKTRKILQRISASVPAHLKSNITKTVVDTSEEEVAKAALAADFISLAKKKKIKKILDSGGFRRVDTILNEEVVKEIDKYYETEIAKAIASGELPDPKNDPFIIARKKRQEEIAAAKLITSLSGQAAPKVIPSSLPQS
jgi:hypothetical protein